MASNKGTGIKVKGLVKVSKNMRARERRMMDNEPGYRAIGPIAVRNVKQHFRNTASPKGKKWAPKKPVAVKFSNGNPTAFDRGYYVRGKFRPKRKTGVGITGELSRTTSFVARRNELIVFNNKNYAGRFHGGFKGTQKVPAHTRKITRAFGRKLKRPTSVRVKSHSFKVKQGARPFLGVSENVQSRINRVMINYWVRGEVKP